MSTRIIEISLQARVSEMNAVSHVELKREVAVCESPSDAWSIAKILSTQFPNFVYHVHHDANGRVITYTGGEMVSDVFPASEMDNDDDEDEDDFENDCQD